MKLNNYNFSSMTGVSPMPEVSAGQVSPGKYADYLALGGVL